MTFPFAGKRSYAANTAASDTLNSNNAAAGFSYRVITPTILFAGSQARVTFKAGPSGSLVINNASIGKSSGSGNTSTTPTELKFSGASGTTITAGNTAVSDWTQIPDGVTTADKIVVIMDAGGTGNFGYHTGTSFDTYGKTATASYNSSSAATFSLSTGDNNGVFLVEVRL